MDVLSEALSLSIARYGAFTGTMSFSTLKRLSWSHMSVTDYVVCKGHMES